MRISNDPGDALDRSQLFGRALRVTAGNHNARPGICAMNFAHRLARLRIRRGRDRAGVQHHDVGGGVFASECQSALEKFAAQRGGIRIGGAAAEIFDGERGHP